MTRKQCTLFESALIRTADRVDEQMRAIRDTHGTRRFGTSATAFCCAMAITAAMKIGAHRRPAGGASGLPLARGSSRNPRLQRLPDKQHRAFCARSGWRRCWAP